MLVKKLNVVKKIDEIRLTEYEGKGYKLIPETLTPEGKPERFACPHCEKDYATEAGLATHIKDKHPETLTPEG